MTELRRSMIECLQLRGLAARTQDMSVRAVRQLAAHERTSPDFITEAELRPYCLDIKHIQPYSRRASPIARCGIKCFFEPTLHREWTTRSFVRAPREQKRPVILSLAEVRRLLGCVRRPRDRAGLSTIDACGLRRQDGTPLHVRDSDSSRLLIHVRHGKGGQDRSVPVPPWTLAWLRQSWGTPRHPVLSFPAPGRGGISQATTTTPMPRSRVQGAFRDALNDSGLHTHASVHTRRHAWAPHGLEAGVTLRRMHVYRGPRAPTPTSVYTHLPASAEPLGADAITRLRGER